MPVFVLFVLFILKKPQRLKCRPIMLSCLLKFNASNATMTVFNMLHANVIYNFLTQIVFVKPSIAGISEYIVEMS